MAASAGDFCSVYITCANRDEALRIARVLVEERAAACANVLGEVTSVYRWQGAIAEDVEIALLVKTRKDLFERLQALVVAHHSYECPCIVAFPLELGFEGYLAWIRAETGG